MPKVPLLFWRLTYLISTQYVLDTVLYMQYAVCGTERSSSLQIKQTNGCFNFLISVLLVITGVLSYNITTPNRHRSNIKSLIFDDVRPLLQVSDHVDFCNISRNCSSFNRSLSSLKPDMEA